MTDTWQPGTTYAPGATVIPTAPTVSVNSAPANASFEDGLTGWNARPGWFADPNGGYNGGARASLAAKAGPDIFIVNTNQVPVEVGQSITAECMIAQGKASSGDAAANVSIHWFNADREQIAISDGNTIDSSRHGWARSTVTAVAPASAAFAAIGCRGYNISGAGPLSVDAFSWNYSNGSITAPLVFTATQALPGKSGATEPDWPTTAGTPVTDNEVTWEGGNMTSVTWTATRLMESGDDEPTWPTTLGSSVDDNTVTWVCTTPQVMDPNCPGTKYVAIVASKVYVADKDIIRYSATSAPLDWSSQNDAGFLPFGLQTYGTNPIAAMGLYRSNLVAFNSEGFQMWQVDEDPANAALQDALPIGCTQHKALSPVSNDLFFLASQGVRTMGIAAASLNLQAGDVGMPIDPLIQQAMAAALDAGIEPLATYYPSAGQYWLAFPEDEPDVFF